MNSNKFNFSRKELESKKIKGGLFFGKESVKALYYCANHWNDTPQFKDDIEAEKYNIARQVIEELIEKERDGQRNGESDISEKDIIDLFSASDSYFRIKSYINFTYDKSKIAIMNTILSHGIQGYKRRAFKTESVAGHNIFTGVGFKGNFKDKEAIDLGKIKKK